jgi:hypothetical protein
MPTLTADNLLTVTKRVELLPYKPRPFIPYEEMTDAEIYNGSGNLVFDSECYPNFFLSAFRSLSTGKVIKLIPPFDPRKLSYILHKYRCIGFNSIKYDIPLLWAAYKNQDTYWLKEVSNSLVNGSWWQEVCKEFEIQIFPTNHIDLIEVCPLKGSLKLYAARLHVNRIQELPYYHMDELSEFEKEVVADYCINGDLTATAVIFSELKEQLELRQNITNQYNIDVMSKSDAQVAESIIGTELKRITGKWPSKPKDFENNFKYELPSFIKFKTKPLHNMLNKILVANFSVFDTGALNRGALDQLSISIGNNVYRLGSGGLHSSEKNASCKSNEQYQIFDVDVASYYPRIVLALSLYPHHIGPNFLTVYNTIVERRLAAKKAKNIAISECLKITINGTFGKTGSVYSILYAPQMMIQITVTGQLGLLMLIEDLELNKIPVYSANTDGIAIYCPVDKIDRMHSIVKEWENKTGFETEETKYKAMYSRDVNAYMAIKENGEAKGKNVYYDPWRAKTARDLYWRFQKNPQAQICVEAIEKLIVNGTPIAQTIRSCKDFTKFVSVKNVKSPGAHKQRVYLGKVVRWYYAKNVFDGIYYIESGNLVADTEGGKPCLDFPETFPDDIDYDRYEAIAKDMLYDMDYLKRPKQIKFF